MAIYIKSTGALWTGETHSLHGFPWTEKNHMSNSLKVELGDDPISARTEAGQYKSDDPSTPLINESKKKPAKKKKAK